MEKALAIIEQIIEEHKTFLKSFEAIERVANDNEALRGFERAQETFVPGRLDQKAVLNKLKEMVEMVSQGLGAHFEREETALLAAFKDSGDEELVAALNTLLLEHKDLRYRLDHTGEHITRLAGGELSRQHWEATAHDMRAHITQTRKLLAAHAGVEQEMMLNLRRRLTGKK
ncbi:MAG: hemerythrin domain-containing protein [Dehalococcoidales bacterium]|jgi:hemerythrin-like domain-containing protein